MSKSDRLLGLIDAANEYGWLVTIRQHVQPNNWTVVLDDDGDRSYRHNVVGNGETPIKALRSALKSAGGIKSIDTARAAMRVGRFANRGERPCEACPKEAQQGDLFEEEPMTNSDTVWRCNGDPEKITEFENKGDFGNDDAPFVGSDSNTVWKSEGDGE